MGRRTGILLVLLALICVPASSQSILGPKAVVLRGVVQDVDGDPMPDVALRCWWINDSELKGPLITMGDPSAHTDAQGHFTLFAQIPEHHDHGLYGFISLQHPDAGLLLSIFDLYSTPSYAGATQLSQVPQQFEPTPEELPVYVLPERTVVTGTVFSASGLPIEGALVTPLLALRSILGEHSEYGNLKVIPYDLSPMLSAATDASGHFTLDGMPAGDLFALRAWHPKAGLLVSGLDMMVAGWPPFTHQTGAEPISLTLPEPGSLSGNVVCWEGSALPDQAHIVLRYPLAPWAEDCKVTIGPGGDFHFDALAAGDWVLVVDASPLVARNMLAVVEPGTHTTVPPFEAGPGATIAGRVVHAQTRELLAGAELSIDIIYQMEEFVASTVDLDTGEFEITARPGVVSLGPRGINCTVTETNPARWLLDHSVRTTGLTISALPHVEVSGTVLLADGSPANGATVRARDGAYARTDSVGRFAFKLPALSEGHPGPHYVTYARASTQLGTLNLESAGRNSEPLLVQLQEAATIVGTLEDSDGMPIPNRRVGVIESSLLRTVVRTREDGRFHLYPVMPGVEVGLLTDFGTMVHGPPLTPGEVREIDVTLQHPDQRQFLPMPMVEVTPPLEDTK